jgi:hypothetical protein
VDLHQAMAGKEMKLEQIQMPKIISMALLNIIQINIVLKVVVFFKV